MKLRNLLITSSLIAAMAIGVPSSVQAATVFTDAGAFTSAVSGATTYSFPLSVTTCLGCTSYTLGPATFSSSDLEGYNDAYGVPYLGDYGNPLSVSTSASAIGFNFGSYDGPQTITYNAGGTTGTFDVPGDRTNTAFLGFTGLSAPLTLTFSNNGELDTTRVIAGDSVAAVPEPSTWAMLLVGFGAVGFGMRRRKRVADGKSVDAAAFA